MWRTPFPMHDGFWGGGGLMLCGGALLLGLLVLLVAYLFVAGLRRAGPGAGTGPVQPPTSQPGTPARALDIARDRYARGEISREEYLQIKSDLEGTQ
ncbi:MAG: SHOCT domain-containing protein [Anaerolineae bacterium]